MQGNEDKNSINYLVGLKEETRNRYEAKPHKPIKAEVAQKQQTNDHLVPSYETLMTLYIQAVQRLNARGKRPLPYVVEAENELNSAWRIVLLGWGDLNYFKQVLSKWELKTGGGDNSPKQEELAF